MKGRVLVTGTSGFIGQHLVRRLVASGWKVKALSRDALPISAAGLEAAVLPDLAGPIDWRPLLDGVSHVVHLAGIAHATATIPEAVYHRVNAEAAGELAKAAVGRVERLVFVSSVRAQTGPSAASILNEDSPPAPTDAYGRSKLAGERLVAMAAGAATILRPVLVYGPGVKGNMAALARLARLPLPLPIARLDGRRSLLDIGGFVTAIELVLTNPDSIGKTLLVADPAPLSLPEIIVHMRHAIGRREVLYPLPRGLLEFVSRLAGQQAAFERLSQNLIVDTARLAALGWRPPRSTSTAIAAMMQDRD